MWYTKKTYQDAETVFFCQPYFDRHKQKGSDITIKSRSAQVYLRKDPCKSSAVWLNSEATTRALLTCMFIGCQCSKYLLSCLRKHLSTNLIKKKRIIILNRFLLLIKFASINHLEKTWTTLLSSYKCINRLK